MLSDLLIRGGLEGGSRVIDELRRRERRQWQEWRIDEELTRLETVFSEAFTDALRDAAEESDHREELRTIARRWENNPEGEDIVMAFDDVDPAVETEAATVSRILAVIQDRVEIGTESREDVREAIIVAYREGFSSFLEEINTKDPDLARLFQEELQMDIQRRITEALDRLDGLAAGPPPRFYRYDPAIAGEVDELVESLPETDPERTAAFVDRSELDDVPETDRLLVVGPAGSGKTRVLGKLAREWAEDVSYVLTPKGSLQVRGQSEWAFERDTYEGDVLLVWDDLHRVDENQENDVIEDVIPAMSEAVEEHGHDLYVLAAARSGDLGDLPGKGLRTPADVETRDRGLWGPFEPLELRTMGTKRLRTLADRTADRLDVDFGGPGEDGDAVRDALVRRATDRSAPEYIDTALRTADGTLAGADVRDLPETAAGVWREQYDKLEASDGRADGDELALLRACKLLYDLGLGRYPSLLIRGVYRHVLERGDSRDEFQDAAEGLADRQWLRIEGGGTYGPGVDYRLHDTQVEAVDRRLESWVREFSEFLKGDRLAGFVRDDGSPDGHELHGRFADVLEETGDHPGRARDHYEAALDLNASSALAHNNYAMLLKNEEAVRDIEAAKAHYERAARLFSARGPPEHFRVSARGLIAACEESSGTADAVRELYRVSVRNTAEGFDDVAERTAGAAWEHRTDLDREDGAYPTALAAGVWYAAHHSLAGWDDAEAVAGTVREAVEPHVDRLSPTVRALYTLRLADEPAPSPDELRERSDAGDDLAEPDIDAYERLLGAFGD